jgi:hypothetical protein
MNLWDWILVTLFIVVFSFIFFVILYIAFVVTQIKERIEGVEKL